MHKTKLHGSLDLLRDVPSSIDQALLRLGLAVEDSKEPPLPGDPKEHGSFWKKWLEMTAALSLVIAVLFVSKTEGSGPMTSTIALMLLKSFGVSWMVLGLVPMWLRFVWIEDHNKEVINKSRTWERYQANKSSSAPKLSSMDFLEKRRLLIVFFRDVVANVRNMVLGPDSKIMMVENEIGRHLEEVRTLILKSRAILDSKRGANSERVVKSQITKQEAIEHRLVSILSSHTAGKEVIMDRLRRFDVALGLLAADDAVQEIVDRTQDLEWQVNRLEEESDAALMGVVKTLVGYMGRIAGGIETLSLYDASSLDLLEGDEGEQAVLRLPDDSTRELQEILREVIPEPALSIG